MRKKTKSSFYQVITLVFHLKLKLKNKSTKIIWYITNIRKDQVLILSKQQNQNNHKLTNLSRNKTPKMIFTQKKLTLPHCTIDI